jgi:hypothetical protein
VEAPGERLPAADRFGLGELEAGPEGATEGGGRRQRGWSSGAAPTREGEGGECTR